SHQTGFYDAVIPIDKIILEKSEFESQLTETIHELVGDLPIGHEKVYRSKHSHKIQHNITYTDQNDGIGGDNKERHEIQKTQITKHSNHKVESCIENAFGPLVSMNRLKQLG